MTNEQLVPVRSVIPIESMEGEDYEDTQLLRKMAREAEDYLRSFSWCKSVESRYFGAGVGGVLGIFMFRISPSSAAVDKWIWVVVGDVPPAYLVIDECKSPSEALTAYLWEMEQWVKLAERGRSSPHVIPVNVPATPEWARQLGSRLESIRINILPLFREAETKRA